MLSGGIGAGAAYAGGKIPGLDKVGGIGPSATAKQKLLGGLIGKTNEGWQGKVGNVLGELGKNALTERGGIDSAMLGNDMHRKVGLLEI